MTVKLELLQLGCLQWRLQYRRLKNNRKRMSCNTCKTCQQRTNLVYLNVLIFRFFGLRWYCFWQIPKNTEITADFTSEKLFTIGYNDFHVIWTTSWKRGWYARSKFEVTQSSAHKTGSQILHRYYTIIVRSQMPSTSKLQPLDSLVS